MNRNSLTSVVLIVAQITVCYIMLESFVVVSADRDSVIYSAPSDNVTVPLGQTTLVNFSCHADGFTVVWIINGMLVDYHDDKISSSYEENGYIFYDDVNLEQGVNISIGINVTSASNNNTELSCSAINSTTTKNSIAVTVTIAGPPCAPQPMFRVVNATHIKVQWDKPFALPEFDVRNFTLLIVNNSSESGSPRNESFLVSADTTYPITYYISNGGDIPKECVYLNFLLTATNDAGRSDTGAVTGGFPIAPSPIPDDTGSLQHKVTFTLDFTPTLHINFTFPEVCDYHDAKYSLLILYQDGSLVYQSMEETYNKDGPENVEIIMSENLQKDSLYTAEINVSTVVNWTTTRFKFDTNITPKPRAIDGIKVVPGNPNIIVIISSSVATALCAVLLGLIIVILTAFIMRRRKLKQRNRAHQRELETDEAVQRAAQAMVPNPIYSGNPIYEEIVDSSMLKSLRNGIGVSETTSRDEGYVAISADAVKNVNWFPLPEESKLVEDKYATFHEDTYTVMNPAGTLSNQSKGPAYEVPCMHHSFHHGNGVLQEQHHLTETNTAIANGEHCAAVAGSAPATADFTTQDEERYVKGAF